MIEFYTFRFPKEHEHSELFAEFLPEADGESVTLFASLYPHPIAETLEEAQESLTELLQENKDLSLDIIKVSQQIEHVS